MVILQLIIIDNWPELIVWQTKEADAFYAILCQQLAWK
jgi:hypothetical protein